MSVLALIPIKPNNHPKLTEQIQLVMKTLQSFTLGLDVIYDHEPEPAQPNDNTPWSKVARIRNKMLDRYPWKKYDWLLWIDADVVDAPLDLVERLIHAATLNGRSQPGIAAPMVMAGPTTWFYDWAAFIQQGTSHIEPTNRWKIPKRNLDQSPPYFDPEPAVPIVAMDCVGCCYVTHTDIFKTGVRFEDHPAFTDHFPICKKAREMNRPVVVDRRVIVRHAWLPDYGEAWH